MDGKTVMAMHSEDVRSRACLHKILTEYYGDGIVCEGVGFVDVYTQPSLCVLKDLKIHILYYTNSTSLLDAHRASHE